MSTTLFLSLLRFELSSANKIPVSHTWHPALKVYCHLDCHLLFFLSPGSPIPYILLLFFYLLFHPAFHNTVVLL